MAQTVNSPFPKLNTPLIDETGNPSIPWYRTLIDMWKKLGGSSSNTPDMVFFQQINGSIFAFDSASGDPLGQIPSLIAGPAQPQILGTSPFVFTATVAGTLVIDSGKVEISRNNGVTWYQCSLQGGAIPMLIADKVRITWFQQTPVVAFLPSQ